MQKQDIETQYIIEDSQPLEDGQRIDTMTINMGPQHPSTHGVLRLILTIEGETVVKAVPDMVSCTPALRRPRKTRPITRP